MLLLNPFKLVVIYSVTPFLCLKADKEDEQTTLGRVCGCVCVCVCEGGGGGGVGGGGGGGGGAG